MNLIKFIYANDFVGIKANYSILSDFYLVAVAVILTVKKQILLFPN